MADTKFIVRKAAVLGAGVMGAQIAAHLIDARVPTILFDLPAKEGNRSAIVSKAIEGLKKLKPSPLAGRDTAALLQAANYDEHLPLLAECDLVIEAIAERLDWKTGSLPQGRAAPRAARHLRIQHLGPVDRQARRGLPAGAAAAILRRALLQSAALHAPRGDHSEPRLAPAVLDRLERFLVTTLGKGVDPRQGHAELRRQPRRASSRCWRRSPTPGSSASASTWWTI